MKETPPVLLIKSLILFLKRKVCFPKNLSGKTIDKNSPFIAYRKVVLKSNKNYSNTKITILRIFFKFAKFSPKANKHLSAFPIPFIISQKGFISKTWLYDPDTEDFQGLYEWESESDAKEYMNSFIIRLMKTRSIPETFKYEISNSGKINK